MVCHNCGKEIEDTAKFCKFCGTPVAKSENFTEKTDVSSHTSEMPTEILSVADSSTVKGQPIAKGHTSAKYSKGIFAIAAIGIGVLIAVAMVVLQNGKEGNGPSIADASYIDAREVGVGNYENQDKSQSNMASSNTPSDVFNSGTFGTNPSVELTVNGDYISYGVYMEFDGGHPTWIEGTALLSNEISFMGNDGQDNIVEGKIYYIDDDTVAVESETVEEAEYGLGYGLDIEYTQLKRQQEHTSSYPESDAPPQLWSFDEYPSIPEGLTPEEEESYWYYYDEAMEYLDSYYADMENNYDYFYGPPGYEYAPSYTLMELIAHKNDGTFYDGQKIIIYNAERMLDFSYLGIVGVIDHAAIPIMVTGVPFAESTISCYINDINESNVNSIGDNDIFMIYGEYVGTPKMCPSGAEQMPVGSLTNCIFQKSN